MYFSFIVSKLLYFMPEICKHQSAGRLHKHLFSILSMLFPWYNIIISAAAVEKVLESRFNS